MSYNNPQQPSVAVLVLQVQGYPVAEYAPAQAPPRQNYTLPSHQQAYSPQDYAFAPPPPPPPPPTDSSPQPFQPPPQPQVYTPQVDAPAPLPAEPSPLKQYASSPPRPAGYPPPDYIPPHDYQAPPHKSNTSWLDRWLEGLCCCRKQFKKKDLTTQNFD